MIPVEYFKALADETRVRILNLLIFREFNVNELVDMLAMGQSRISRHLKILVDCGLITCRRDGLWAFYSAVESGQGGRFIDSIRYMFKESRTLKGDISAARKAINESHKRAIRFFDSMAEDWDSIKRDIIGGTDLAGEIGLRLNPCRVAVDLGCGTGDLLPPLLGSAEKVIGVDNSPEMLKKAELRFTGSDDRIDLRIGQLEHLPMRDGEADCAVINMVLHHLPEPASGIVESFRVIRDGGYLAIVDLEKHNLESMRSRYGDRWLGFTKKEIEGWLTGAGYTIQESARFELKKGLKAIFYLSRKDLP